MEYRFTTEQALQAMREAVAEKGDDYIYPKVDGSCFYADAEGNPSCLVGHVIYRLDPAAFRTLAAVEDEHGTTSAVELTRMDHLDGNFWSDATGETMQTAQTEQDQGVCWGDALAAAEDDQ